MIEARTEGYEERICMKNRLRHQLTYPFRKFARRMIVRVVGRVAYTIGDLWNIAVCNGLDVERVTRFDNKLNLLAQPMPAPAPRQIAESGDERQLNIEDLLFLMDAAKQWKFEPLMVDGTAKPYVGILALIVSWDTEKSGKQCPKEKRRA